MHFYILIMINQKEKVKQKKILFKIHKGINLTKEVRPVL